MHYTRLTAAEALKISRTHEGDPFCITIGHLHKLIEDEAYRGASNCFVTVPEEKLYEFKCDLIKSGFRVFSTQLERRKFTWLNNIFDRYPNYKDLYQLDIEWH